MYTTLIILALSNLLYFALHVTPGGSFPLPLSAKEERECLEKIRDGDIAARGHLIEHNLRLVAHIIKRYYSNFKEQEDLISIGTIGLIKAASTYDCSKGTRFATYASRCIENEILMHFRNQRKCSQDIFIYDPIDIDKEGNPLTLQEVMYDDDNIIDHIELRLKSEQMYKFIKSSLSERERKIITMRYGLYCTEPLTQREVAANLNISRSYVSRIEKKAVNTLKRLFKRDGFMF
jgi:RNA polymerase sporulation-specific sigma factor